MQWSVRFRWPNLLSLVCAALWITVGAAKFLPGTGVSLGAPGGGVWVFFVGALEVCLGVAVYLGWARRPALVLGLAGLAVALLAAWILPMENCYCLGQAKLQHEQRIGLIGIMMAVTGGTLYGANHVCERRV